MRLAFENDMKSIDALYTPKVQLMSIPFLFISFVLASFITSEEKDRITGVFGIATSLGVSALIFQEGWVIAMFPSNSSSQYYTFYFLIIFTCLCGFFFTNKADDDVSPNDSNKRQ